MERDLQLIGKVIKRYGTAHLRPDADLGAARAVIVIDFMAPIGAVQVREYLHENRISLLVRTGRNEETGEDELRPITCRVMGRAESVADGDRRRSWHIRLKPDDEENAELMRAFIQFIAIENDDAFARISWTEFVKSLSIHAPGDEPDPRLNPDGAHEFPNEEFVEQYCCSDDPESEVAWHDTIVPGLRDHGDEIARKDDVTGELRRPSLAEAIAPVTEDSSSLRQEASEYIDGLSRWFDSLGAEPSGSPA